MGYCVWRGDNFLLVIVWGMMAICYGLLCWEWW